jgi:hypothetical protein
MKQEAIREGLEALTEGVFGCRASAFASIWRREDPNGVPSQQRIRRRIDRSYREPAIALLPLS